MNKWTRILALLSCLALLVRPGMGRAAMAAEMDASQKDNEYAMGTVAVPEKEVFANVARAVSGNGTVTGDGVRLRKNPSSSATVLALMYTGEKVIIFTSSSTANWYFVERVKTGMLGYAAKECISRSVC